MGFLQGELAIVRRGRSTGDVSRHSAGQIRFCVTRDLMT